MHIGCLNQGPRIVRGQVRDEVPVTCGVNVRPRVHIEPVFSCSAFAEQFIHPVSVLHTKTIVNAKT